MGLTSLAETLRPLLKKGMEKRSKESALLDAAGGNAALLARALWQIVVDGDGVLVAQDRRFMAGLAPQRGRVEVCAADFLSLLRAVARVRPGWLRPDDEQDGIVYAGWCVELERILDRVEDAGSLSAELSPPLPEALASSLRFALARRGHPADLSGGALERFATAFVKSDSPAARRAQFAGVERVWAEETWAKAVWTAAAKAEDVGVEDTELAPLVRHASDEQLVTVAIKLLDAGDEDRLAAWLVARGDAVAPSIERRVEEAVREQRGRRFPGDVRFFAGVLARVFRDKGLAWPERWMSLARHVLETGRKKAVRDVLTVVAPEAREHLLIERLEGPIGWALGLEPLTWFPTDRLVEAVEAKAKKGKTDRHRYLDVLKAMGDRGQRALRALSGRKDAELASDALRRVRSTAAAAPRIAELLQSRDEAVVQSAVQLLMKGDDAMFFGILDDAAIPPGHAARLLATRPYHPQAPRLAARLPDSEETRPHRALCLLRPAALAALSEAMYTVDEAALKKARSALAPLFSRTRFLTDERGAAVMGKMPLADLPAALRVIVQPMHDRLHKGRIVKALTKRFAARPEIAWAAVMWLSEGDAYSLAGIEASLGAAIVEPLRARLALGSIARDARRPALDILARHDAAGSLQVFVDNVADESVRPSVVGGMRAALQSADGAEAAPIRRWLAASLDGRDDSALEVALEVLAQRPDPGLMPALERLRGAELDPAARRKLATALAAFQSNGAPRRRSQRALSATSLHKVKGAIRSLHVSARGTVLGAHADAFHVFRGQRETIIEDRDELDACLSLGGRYVLVIREADVAVHVPSEGSEAVDELSAGDGLGAVVPLPGGRLVTLSVSNNSGYQLSCWDLDSGSSADHSKAIDCPWTAAPLDRERYVVGGMTGEVAVVDIASGKARLKLCAGGSPMVEEVCAGGGHVLSRQEDGTLRFWAVGGTSFELLAEHRERARGAKLAVDRRSSWAATLHADHVQPWRAGQPARPLCVDGGPRDRSGDRRSLVFVRRGVLAVGGDGLDLWDLEAGTHLGRLDQAVTALCAQAGQLYAGDAKGRVFRIDVG